MMLAAPNIFICLISLAAIDKGKIFLSKCYHKVIIKAFRIFKNYYNIKNQKNIWNQVNCSAVYFTKH